METSIRERLICNGVDVEAAIDCLGGKEDLYMRYLRMFFEDEDFDNLEKEMKEKDYPNAISPAHALKGMAGNLRIQKVWHELTKLVDDLRAQQYDDVDNLYCKIIEDCKMIKGVIEEA